jgi:predicted nucleic acid-binding protein
MAFVIDAPIAATWLLPDESSPMADAGYRRLPAEDAWVPSLWWFEMRNIFLINERRGRIDATKSDQALALLANLPIRVDQQADGTALVRLARQHRLTAYDAAYLELALRRALPLATLDRALADAARTEKVPLIGER